MVAPALMTRMTCEQFLAWVDARAARLTFDESKWELFDGIPEMQEHETWRHAQVKVAVMLSLRAAIHRAAMPLEVGIDGLGVRISQKESYRPEVVVFPKGLIADTDRHAPEPVIVVEVLSPSTRNKDLKLKVDGYARVATIGHYLVIDPDSREVLHYRRDGDELVALEVLSGGAILKLDPPGLAVPVDDMLA